VPAVCPQDDNSHLSLPRAGPCLGKICDPMRVAAANSARSDQIGIRSGSEPDPIPI
jgi:hypothetical protein